MVRLLLVLIFLGDASEEDLAIKVMFGDRVGNNTHEHGLNGVTSAECCGDVRCYFVRVLIISSGQDLEAAVAGGGVKPLFIDETSVKVAACIWNVYTTYDGWKVG